MTRGGAATSHDETLLRYLSRELARLHTESPELPFDLNGGFVGYLGYELKADCGAAAAHEAELPDAFLLLADRLVVIDHELEQTHVLALSDGGAARRAAADGAGSTRPRPRSTTCRRSTSRAMLDHGEAALEFAPATAAASTTSPTSRPASACSSRARATRSA